MSELASMSLKIDENIIKQKVESIVMQQIAAQLGDPGEYIERVVNRACGQKVDQDGKVSSCSAYNTVPLIEHVAKNAIEQFVRGVVLSWVDSNKEKIQKALEKQLIKLIPAMATLVTENVKQNAGNRYVAMNISFNAAEGKEY